MTTKQKILKALCPFISAVSKALGAKGTILINKANALPVKSIFELTYTDNQGNTVSFETYKGKKMLLVNTASDCGYTAQYDELQELFNSKKDELVIIAFPSNDFKQQEKGDDNEIEQFCRKNYGITFPLARKSVVSKKENQDTDVPVDVRHFPPGIYFVELSSNSGNATKRLVIN